MLDVEVARHSDAVVSNLPRFVLVEGTLNGVIHDLETGNVFQVNNAGVEVLSGRSENQEFTTALDKIGITNVVSLSEAKKIIGKEKSPRTVPDFIHLEITPDCDKRCIHCYGSFGENKPIMAPPENSLSFEGWKNIISQIYEIGTRGIQFIGGEPFQYFERKSHKTVLDLISFAREIENPDSPFFIEVFTSGTVLTDKKINFLKEKNVHLAVSVYSDDPNVHDSITQVPGSHRLTMEGIARAKAAGIPVRIGFVAMNRNEATLESTQNMFTDMGIKEKKPDIIRPSGSGVDRDLLPSLEARKKYEFTMKRPNFSISRSQFISHLTGNPCLDGKLTISYDGSVLACIFTRHMKLGNLQNQSLDQIVRSESVQSIWTNTLENVLVCGDCEFRVCCGDCRPLSYGTNPNSDVDIYNAPPARCTYNPFSGEWGKGAWRMENGGVQYILFEALQKFDQRSI